ncbi:hypothetical protein HNR46_003660 [Haloferula luteola]|uniref:Uncharacterized protein n=1 Tax=Haloferula luteola TaxID=595692 RepID=A0A840V6V1_9BACT|nr:hypothetical protein [Haloferula luteola]MBB5353403.1 hypothetical protein [Haloferula luteola]
MLVRAPGPSIAAIHSRLVKIGVEDLRCVASELHVHWPVYSNRKRIVELRKRVRRLMRIMSLTAVVPKPRTSVPDPNQRKHP